MAQLLSVYHPFASGPGANAQSDKWRAMARYMATNGPVPGVLNELEVWANGSAREVYVKSGRGFVEGCYGELSAQITLPIAANGTGSTRTDRVVLRNGFEGTNTLELDVLTGASGGGTPAPTQSTALHEVTLAQIAVANGASTIADADITDERVCSGAPGGVLISPEGGRPIVANCGAPYEGLTVYDRIANALYTYDGAVWRPIGASGPRLTYTPTITASGGGFALGNGTVTGRYRVVNGELSAKIRFAVGTGGGAAVGTGSWRFTIPAGLTLNTSLANAEDPLGTAMVVAASGNRYRGVVRMASATLLSIIADDGTSSAVGGTLAPAGSEVWLNVAHAELA